MKPHSQPVVRGRRPVTAVLCAIAAVLLAMATSLVTVPPSAEASVVGGAVTRSETLSRAQNWVNRGITYTQFASASDPDGGHTYRRDCSGLVSMAWHLGSSLLTHEFLAQARSGNGIKIIPRDQLKPGDAMVRDSDGAGKDGHMELFSHWKNPNNHREGAYVYSFNKEGQTVQNPYAENNVGLLGFNGDDDMNTFTFIRYQKVDGERVSDFSGDGFADVLGVNADGNLMYYPNNNLTISPSTARQIGQGWGAFKHVAAGDFSGDGFADVLGVSPDGNLLYYPNNNLGLPSSGQQLATGWGSVKQVMAGDFSGDGHADIIAVNADGNLMYYPNNNLTISPSTARQIGQGWGAFKHVMASDFSGDGYADVLGVNAEGNLMYYPNNNLALSSSGQQLATGWGAFGQVFASDFSGDGHADLLAINADGNLVYYPNNNLTISPSTARQLATGWAGFTQVM